MSHRSRGRISPLVSAAARRVRLLPLLLTDPGGFRDHVKKDLELVADRMRQAPASYAPIGWLEALGELDHRFAGAAAFAAESHLGAIEMEVRNSLSRLADGPWGLQYNCDLALARCVYVLCRALQPEVVVETGVAYGVSSAFMLQALEVNQRGRLWSVDLAPLGNAGGPHVGALIPQRLRSRWDFLSGTSEAHLPRITADRTVDLFLHDSLHTYRTMRWEFETVWPDLRQGGVLVSDDIDGNNAFAELAEKASYSRAIREEQKEALFGIAVK